MKYYHSPKKKKKKSLKKICMVLLIILSLIIIVESIDLLLNRDKIFKGVTASGVDVGGLKREEVSQVLKPVISEIINSPRILTFEDNKFTFIPVEDLWAKVDLNQEINRLYRIARSGNIFNRIKERITTQRRGYQLDLTVKFDDQKMKVLEGKIAELVERAPIDAYLENNYIRESQDGIEVDFEELEERIITSLNNYKKEEYYLKIPVKIIPPQYSTEDLLEELGLTQEISNYSTVLKNRDGNTIFNIRLAAKKINGRVIKPGEIFSFNQIVGPAEKEDGFKEGTIIANGKFIKGYGGGVCQVSSTLYNSVILANLMIIERYNHSVYGDATTYVPLGRDAAVFYGYKDLKFRNNLSDKIVIFARVAGEILTVSIYGNYPHKPEIEIISKDKKIIDYQVIRENDPGLEEGQEIVFQEGNPGYQIKTYRIIKKAEEEKVELLSNDTYNDIPKIIREN